MKKIVSIFCAAVTSCAMVLPLTACGGDDKDTVHVYMPDGAPAIALSALMDSGYAGFDFTVVPSDEIAGVVSNGTADIALMPIDAAARLYNGKNNNTDIVMLSVNTHGNLYIVGGNSDIMLTDLKGKKLGVIGQGSVPDNVLRILLENSGIEYRISEDEVDNKVALTYNAATTLIPMLKQGKLDYILLGEPAVTNAVNVTGGKIAMDMQEQWDLAFVGGYPQACLVAKGSLIDERKSDIDKFLAAVKESDGWAKQNPDKAQKAVENNMKAGNETTLKALNAEIIEHCNIKTVSAEDSREQCDKYFQKLNKLFAAELDTPVLSKVPDLEFYYKP